MQTSNFRWSILGSGLACSLLLAGCDPNSLLPGTGTGPRASASPTSRPVATPTPIPTSRPSSLPSTQPSLQPTPLPSVLPSVLPTVQPSVLPTVQPSSQPAGPCGTTADLKTAALPAGLTLPSGMEARIFNAPEKMATFGNVFFDAKGQAYVFSSQDGVKQIYQTDPCGKLTPAVSNDILLGRGGKSAVVDANGNFVVSVDYWPDGGTSSNGLYDLTPAGQASAIKLPHNPAGMSGVIAAPRGERFLATTAATEPDFGSFKTPAGAQTRILKSNFTFGPLGHGFYDASGNFYVFTSSAHRKQIARIDPKGNSTIVADNELLRFAQWRSGAPAGTGVIAAIDYAPAAGGQATGLHQFNADGTVTEWKTAQGHSGLFDVIPGPNGGYYFSDFENDNVWYKADATQAEVGVIDPAHSVVPAALASLAYDPGSSTLYALNRKNTEWWGSGAGEKGVYQIKGGIATLLAKADDASQFSGLALGQGGIFGSSLYTIDDKTKSVVKVNADGTLTPVVSGLPNPYALKIDPVSGTMAILCDNRFVVFVGDQVPAYAPDPVPGKGYIMSEFESDNVWYLPSRGGEEPGLLEADIPPGLYSPIWNDNENELYALNRKGGWPFGGEETLYRIQSNGKAVLALKAAADETFGDIAMGDGRQFPKDLLLVSNTGNQVSSVRNGVLKPLITGLPKPGGVRIDPVTGNMLILANDSKSLVWIGKGLGSSTPVPVASPADKGSKVFDNGNILAVYNGSPCAPGFSLSQPTQITEIMDYHWNDAKGANPPGQIGLKSSTGSVFGPWDITTSPGQGGVPNAYWYARPNAVVPAGTYTITDSQPGSWSYNTQSGCSMSWVYGIPQ